jgi:Ca-activated chloride channel family protein
MKIDARLTLNKVRFDQDADAHLVLSLTAPTLNVEAKRPPLCVVPLIDLSSSMEGVKLAYAKRSLIKLIDHLTPNDYCGLITFAYQSEVVQKPIRCTAEAKDDLKRKVGALNASGCTNIADALLDGFKVANGMDLANEVITRVILFTDGAANHGPVRTPIEILALVEPNIGIASVSAFGYGQDAQQDFLLNLSKSGSGNYSFVQNPDDALSAFGKELGGLLSTYATNLVVEVSPLAGHRVAQVVSDVDAEEEEDLGQVVIKIPDILTEEDRHIVLAVKLKEQKTAFPREVNVFDVKISYDTLDATLRREHKVLEAKAKVQFVKAGEEQTEADKELDRIVGLAQIVRAQIEAEEHAKQGHFNEAASVMRGVSGTVGSRGLADLGIVAHNLADRLGSRTAYTNNSAYLASFSRGATRGLGGTYDAHAAADLKIAGVVMSNSSQARVEASFNSDEGTAGPVSLSGGDAVSGAGSANGTGAEIDWGSITTGRPTIDTVAGSGANIAGGGINWGAIPGAGAVNQWVGGPTPVPADPAAPIAIMTPFLVKPAAKPEKPAKGKKRKVSQKSNRW